jgi:hypothetical protein
MNKNHLTDLEFDPHAKEDCSGIENEPGHSASKQFNTLKSKNNLILMF